nr:MBL fold metallo-hydrolase [uncultured Butyrivibrio sp.]
MKRKRKKKSILNKAIPMSLLLGCAYMAIGCYSVKTEQPGKPIVASSDTSKPTEGNTGISAAYTEIAPEYNCNTVHVDYIDVGQGDCSLIYDETANFSCMIDTGLYESYDNVQAALSEYGIDELDVLILTHPDTDHIQSAVDVIEDYNVSSVYMSRAVNPDAKSYEYLVEYLESYQGNIVYPDAGDSIYSSDDTKISIIGPCSYGDLEDTNGHSLVIRLDNGNDSFLFLGDATGSEIEEVMSSGFDLEADVLKASHHGSANNGCNSENLFNSALSKYLIVSCAYGNEYGHPHKETMDLARKYNMKLFRTDLQGSISCVSTGSGIKWSQEPTGVYTNGSGL